MLIYLYKHRYKLSLLAFMTVFMVIVYFSGIQVGSRKVDPAGINLYSSCKSNDYFSIFQILFCATAVSFVTACIVLKLLGFRFRVYGNYIVASNLSKHPNEFIIDKSYPKKDFPYPGNMRLITARKKFICSHCHFEIEAKSKCGKTTLFNFDTHASPKILRFCMNCVPILTNEKEAVLLSNNERRKAIKPLMIEVMNYYKQNAIATVNKNKPNRND